MSLSTNKILAQWQSKNLATFGFLFHGVRSKNGELFATPAEQVFSNWDVISLSFVDTSCSILRGIFPVGFLCDVPPQNILGTHPYDVCFPNHIGTARDNTRYPNDIVRAASLTRALQTGRDKREQVSIAHPDKFRRLMTPLELIDEQLKINCKYNEVLAVGRAGVNIYSGLPATQNIRVLGIYSGGKGDRSVFKKLCSANPGVRHYDSYRDLLDLKYRCLHPG